jgi:polysaccharide biosynthesis/export protein
LSLYLKQINNYRTLLFKFVENLKKPMYNKLKNLNALIIGILIFSSSCVSKKQILLIQDLNNTDISKISIFKNVIQENDILKIDVNSLERKASIPFNNISLSNNMGNPETMRFNGYLVNNNTINFPILGKVNVTGKTIKDLEKDLEKRLEFEGYLIKPEVIIRLLNAKVTILGEVNMPGTYSFSEQNISLLQAIGLAGDLTIDGNRKDIIIIREINGTRTSSKIDLTSADWLTGPYQSIVPNDVIIINPNSKKIKSAGIIGNFSTFLSIASILLSTIILIR